MTDTLISPQQAVRGYSYCNPALECICGCGNCFEPEGRRCRRLAQQIGYGGMI